MLGQKALLGTGRPEARAKATVMMGSHQGSQIKKRKQLPADWRPTDWSLSGMRLG